MAEVTSSVSTKGFSTVSTSSTAPVVAPPKFLFGSEMSKRVKQNLDDGSDTSDHEEEQMPADIDFLEYASSALKRSADSEDDESADFNCPDFSFNPKKIKKKDPTESKSSSVLRPSALSAIAEKLSNPKQEDEINQDKEHDHSAKTHGESSNSNTSSDNSTTISRPHLIDTPAALNAGAESQNYFQQFLSGSCSSSTSESKGSFVFGQNIRDRVNVETPSKENEEVATTVSEKVTSPKSLADVADTVSTTDTDTETAGSSIAAAAQKYESEHSPPKKNLAEINVMTGEEDERNVIQLSCRLFVFCKESHSWLGRGRVTLKLNDHCELNAEGTFHSRLVARTQGNLRLVLNTKLWPDMVVEKASDKAIRVSVMEDGNVNLYLIMAAPREALQLYTAMDRRIETLKREKVHEKKTDDESVKSCDETSRRENLKENKEEENLSDKSLEVDKEETANTDTDSTLSTDRQIESHDIV
ncbi:ran-binding protein 3-like [Dendronephthya gigantea]|uniref:ran-binding protein 3-like n=1 Tax=Dendronephthya gigantea TaxID=151771 RepID=UPI00106A49F0|nr:ran-binding protein 3-like [Dendronephthya gigantea]